MVKKVAEVINFWERVLKDDDCMEIEDLLYKATEDIPVLIEEIQLKERLGST